MLNKIILNVFPWTISIVAYVTYIKHFYEFSYCKETEDIERSTIKFAVDVCGECLLFATILSVGPAASLIWILSYFMEDLTLASPIVFAVVIIIIRRRLLKRRFGKDVFER